MQGKKRERRTGTGIVCNVCIHACMFFMYCNLDIVCSDKKQIEMMETFVYTENNFVLK